MKKCVLAILLGIIVGGCGSKEDVRDIEWRAKEGYEETQGKKEAVAIAKDYMAEGVRGVVVAFEDDTSADFSHVEYDIAAEDDGHRLTGHYMALYHSTGKLSGFPGGYFVLKISKDGAVERIESGE
jgi:hypothetical protein